MKFRPCWLDIAIAIYYTQAAGCTLILGLYTQAGGCMSMVGTEHSSQQLYTQAGSYILRLGPHL